MEMIYGEENGAPLKVSAASVLWDDPLMGIVWHEMLARDPEIWKKALRHYKELRDKTEAHREDRSAGIINHAWNLLNVLARKTELRAVLVNAYKKRDFSTLGVVAEKYVPEVIDALEGLNDSFRGLRSCRSVLRDFASVMPSLHAGLTSFSKGGLKRLTSWNWNRRRGDSARHATVCLPPAAGSSELETCNRRNMP